MSSDTLPEYKRTSVLRRKMPVTQNIDLQQKYYSKTGNFSPKHRAAYLRQCESAVYSHKYNAEHWNVDNDRQTTSWDFRDVFRRLDLGHDLFRPQLDVHDVKGQLTLFLDGLPVNRPSASTFEWNGQVYKIRDYREKDILVPDLRMWRWFEQRKISLMKLWFRPEDTINESNYDRVVFGTKSDHYTHFPEKYGYLGRRRIQNVSTSWKVGYEQRLCRLNPLRGQGTNWILIGRKAKWTKSMLGKSDEQVQQRWDEINEESGLRIKHSPCILMVNQFVTTYRQFIGTYLDGSQGVSGLEKGIQVNRARPGHLKNGAFVGGHVTDHELYRMFTGKHRKRILDYTLFGDGDLKIFKVGKRKEDWLSKNQISRSLRIKNQN